MRLATEAVLWYALNIRPVMYVSAMRIACVFVPHLPLQAVVRRRPALRKHAVAIVSGGPASSVVACSRQAHAAGVRVGMPAYVARQKCVEGVEGSEFSELLLEARDLEAEQQLEASLAEALYGLSSRVEAEQLGNSPRSGEASAATAGTLFAEVPSGMRGATFGARVLELAAELEVAVRVGIADDRFTAWVAARHAGHHNEEPVIAIPRGGSAAFLAPQPLSLLDISPEVQHMLAALGVRTLGEFASLPAPSVARHWDIDFQGLARGEGGAQLVAMAPSRLPLREEVVLGGEVGLGEAMALVAERIALRLSGRGAAATAMEVAVETSHGLETSSLGLVPPLDDAQAIADRIGRAVGASGVRRLLVSVTAAPVGSAPSQEVASVEPAPVVSALASAIRRAAPPASRRREVAATAEDESLVGMSNVMLRRMEVAPPGEPLHRRTRRGKQRRRVVAAQARLFGND